MRWTFNIIKLSHLCLLFNATAAFLYSDPSGYEAAEASKSSILQPIVSANGSAADQLKYSDEVTALFNAPPKTLNPIADEPNSTLPEVPITSPAPLTIPAPKLTPPIVPSSTVSTAASTPSVVVPTAKPKPKQTTVHKVRVWPLRPGSKTVTKTTVNGPADLKSVLNARAEAKPHAGTEHSLMKKLQYAKLLQEVPKLMGAVETIFGSMKVFFHVFEDVIEDKKELEPLLEAFEKKMEALLKRFTSKEPEIGRNVSFTQPLRSIAMRRVPQSRRRKFVRHL